MKLHVYSPKSCVFSSLLFSSLLFFRLPLIDRTEKQATDDSRLNTRTTAADME